MSISNLDKLDGSYLKINFPLYESFVIKQRFYIDKNCVETWNVDPILFHAITTKEVTVKLKKKKIAFLKSTKES